MKKDFDPVLLREHLNAWNNADAARRRLGSTIEKANVGESVNNPAPLPAEVANKPAAARCEWALARLAEERKNIADSRLREQLGGKLRARLEELRAQKQAAESARARKRLVRLTLVTAVFVVIAAVVFTIWWQRRPPSISKSAVEKIVAGDLGKRGLSLTSLTFQVGSKHGGAADVYSSVTAKLDQPLYINVPAERYLQDELKLDLTANRKIAELTGVKEGRRLLELAGLAAPPPDLTKVALVKVATPAGNTFSGMVNLTAADRSGGWELSLRSISVPGLPQNQFARGQFTGEVFDVSRDEDRARLRALADEQTQILAKLERARETYLAEVLAQHRKEEQSLISFFRPGTIFTSTFNVRNVQKPVYLEVTEAAGGSGVHALKAMFHNDGGWGDGRLFEGEWKLDLAKARFAVSLVSRSDQAVRNGGPVLDDPKMVNLELALDGERLSGQLAGTPSEWTRVPDADTAKVKREASPDYFAMLDMITPAAIYQGSVKLNQTDTQQILLRFTRAPDGNSPIEAVVEDPEHEAWQFKLSGPLIGNRYREANWPLRLTEVRDTMPPGISPKSVVLQFRALALRMESGTLMGDYRGRPFRFERLAPEETTRRQQSTAARKRMFNATLQPGIVIEGTAVDPTKAQRIALRLRVLTVDPAKNAVEARLESSQSSTLYRTLAGKIFPDAGVAQFTFDTRANTYGIARTAVEPWFKGGRDSLLLELDGMTLKGQDGHKWDFEFRPRGGF